MLLKDTEWQFEDEYELVQEDIGLIADQCRSDETKKMVNLIEVCAFIISFFIYFKYSLCLLRAVLQMRLKLADRYKHPLGSTRFLLLFLSIFLCNRSEISSVS